MDKISLIFIIIVIGFIIITLSLIFLIKNRNIMVDDSTNKFIKNIKNKIGLNKKDLDTKDLNIILNGLLKQSDDKQKMLISSYDILEAFLELDTYIKESINNMQMEKGEISLQNIDNMSMAGYTQMQKTYTNNDENQIQTAYYNKIDVEDMDNSGKIHPMLPIIKSLTKKGASVSDIARELSMGQGEVKLIMEFGKDFL